MIIHSCKEIYNYWYNTINKLEMSDGGSSALLLVAIRLQTK
jgi:hypothetical protein